MRFRLLIDSNYFVSFSESSEHFRSPSICSFGKSQLAPGEQQCKIQSQNSYSIFAKAQAPLEAFDRNLGLMGASNHQLRDSAIDSDLQPTQKNMRICCANLDSCRTIASYVEHHLMRYDPGVPERLCC